mgnify:CR=1 FL=1
MDKVSASSKDVYAIVDHVAPDLLESSTSETTHLIRSVSHEKFSLSNMATTAMSHENETSTKSKKRLIKLIKGKTSSKPGGAGGQGTAPNSQWCVSHRYLSGSTALRQVEAENLFTATCDRITFVIGLMQCAGTVRTDVQLLLIYLCCTV